jgi:hypothetical protein
MKTARLIISFFLIVGYLIGLTNNLMPRCESESAHVDHIVSIHVNHFHNSTPTKSELAHIGHEDHDDETSFVKILQHFFDDIENPKEKCEFGFFASIHNYPADVKSFTLYTVLKSPALFLTAINDSKENLKYIAPNYAPPDRQSQQQRGPPFFLV